MTQPPANDHTLPPVLRESEEVMYSRPTSTSPFGKCRESVEVAMPEPLKELLARLASLEQKAVATYCREVLESHALIEQERVRRILTVFGDKAHPENPR